MNAQEVAKQVIEKLGLKKELFQGCGAEHIGGSLMALPQVVDAVITILAELPKEELVEVVCSAIPHLHKMGLNAFALTAVLVMMSQELRTEEKLSSEEKVDNNGDGQENGGVGKAKLARLAGGQYIKIN